MLIIIILSICKSAAIIYKWDGEDNAVHHLILIRCRGGRGTSRLDTELGTRSGAGHPLNKSGEGLGGKRG